MLTLKPQDRKYHLELTKYQGKAADSRGVERGRSASAARPRSMARSNSPKPAGARGRCGRRPFALRKKHSQLASKFDYAGTPNFAVDDPCGNASNALHSRLTCYAKWLLTFLMPMSDRKLNIAIVGLGFGAEFIPIYQRHPNAQ